MALFVEENLLEIILANLGLFLYNTGKVSNSLEDQVLTWHLLPFSIHNLEFYWFWKNNLSFIHFKKPVWNDLSLSHVGKSYSSLGLPHFHHGDFPTSGACLFSSLIIPYLFLLLGFYHCHFGAIDNIL